MSFASPAELVIAGDHKMFDFPALRSLTDRVEQWKREAPNDRSHAIDSNTQIHPIEVVDFSNIKDSIIAVDYSAMRFLEMEYLEPLLKKICSRRNGIFLTGAYWLQYMAPTFNHASILRNKITVRKDEKYINQRNFKFDRINIALHIRHGDYEYWEGGRYYFDLQENLSILKALAARWPDARFHIFSNVNVADNSELRALKASLDLSLAPDASGSDDFLGMTNCDIIVGPPSTFGTWAAFLGSAKRLVLTKDRVLSLIGGEDPASFLVDIERPTWCYIPGVVGPT
jgi:hypothetical protein